MRQSILLLTALSLLLGSVIANAGERGWYIGIGLGEIRANYEIADFDDGSVSAGLVDNSDSAWKVFGGYQINRYLAIEVGFSDLHNDVDKRTTFSGISNGTGSRFVSLPGGAVSVDINDITGHFVAALGSLPLTRRFDLVAKAGAISWDAQQTTVDLNQRTHTLNGTDALFGLGIEYRFDNGIEIRGEVERYFNVGATDQNVAALSISYKFQRRLGGER